MLRWISLRAWKSSTFLLLWKDHHPDHVYALDEKKGVAQWSLNKSVFRQMATRHDWSRIPILLPSDRIERLYRYTRPFATCSKREGARLRGLALESKTYLHQLLPLVPISRNSQHILTLNMWGCADLCNGSTIDVGLSGWWMSGVSGVRRTSQMDYNYHTYMCPSHLSLIMLYLTLSLYNLSHISCFAQQTAGRMSWAKIMQGQYNESSPDRSPNPTCHFWFERQCCKD